MEKEKKTPQDDPMKGYDPTDRDFQRAPASKDDAAGDDRDQDTEDDETTEKDNRRSKNNQNDTVGIP